MSNLNQLMHDINKKYGSEIIKQGTDMIYVEKIPFSSPRANYLTYGGIPIGKGTELVGPEGGGKTTTAIDVVKNAQLYAKKEHEDKLDQLGEELASIGDSTIKRDKERVKAINEELEYLHARGPRKVVYVDTENTLDEDWAKLNGVDTESLILMRPEEQTGEQILQMIVDICASGDVLLVVLDSIPALVSQKLYEEDIEKRAYGGIADAMGRFTAKITPILSRLHVALVMINQVRDDLNNPFNIWHSPGGRALKHFYSLRIGFQKGSLLDEENKEIPQRSENPAGNRVSMTIIKTKVSKPNRRLGYYTLNYTNGIDVMQDTIDTAIQYGMIQQAGAWFRFIDIETGEIMVDDEENEMKFNGKTALLNFLKENEFIFEELWEAVNEKVKEVS